MTIDINSSGRRAAGLVTLGIAVQLIASLYWTPGTFVLAAAIGVPLVVVGVILFGRVVWRASRRGDA